MERDLEQDQMAYWWARKEAEYATGAVVVWNEDGGSSGSGAWLTRDGTERRRPSFAEAGWTGGVRGQRVHHSVDVRAAWWGETESHRTGDDEVVIDLGEGRAASAAVEADYAARARKMPRRT